MPATVRLRVLRDGKWVATPYTGTLPAGPQSLGWNGAKRVGKTLDGSYTAVIDATDAVGTATVSLPFLLDAHPPVVKLAARPVRLWVSEAATVTVRVNGSAPPPAGHGTRLPPAHRHPQGDGRSSSSRAIRRATRRSSASPDRSSEPAPVE